MTFAAAAHESLLGQQAQRDGRCFSQLLLVVHPHLAHHLCFCICKDIVPNMRLCCKYRLLLRFIIVPIGDFYFTFRGSGANSTCKNENKTICKPLVENLIISIVHSYDFLWVLNRYDQ